MLEEPEVVPPPAPELVVLGGLAWWRPPLERMEIRATGDLTAAPATHAGHATVTPPAKAGATSAAAKKLATMAEAERWARDREVCYLLCWSTEFLPTVAVRALIEDARTELRLSRTRRVSLETMLKRRKDLYLLLFLLKAIDEAALRSLSAEAKRSFDFLSAKRLGPPSIQSAPKQFPPRAIRPRRRGG